MAARASPAKNAALSGPRRDKFLKSTGSFVGRFSSKLYGDLAKLPPKDATHYDLWPFVWTALSHKVRSGRMDIVTAQYEGTYIKKAVDRTQELPRKTLRRILPRFTL